MCVTSNSSSVSKGLLMYDEHISVCCVIPPIFCWSDGSMVTVVTSNEIVRWGVVVWKNGNRGRGGGGMRVGTMTSCMVEFEGSGGQHFIGCGRFAIGVGVPLWRSPRVFKGNRGGRGVAVWEFNCSAV